MWSLTIGFDLRASEVQETVAYPFKGDTFGSTSFPPWGDKASKVARGLNSRAEPGSREVADMGGRGENVKTIGRLDVTGPESQGDKQLANAKLGGFLDDEIPGLLGVQVYQVGMALEVEPFPWGDKAPVGLYPGQ